VSEFQGDLVGNVQTKLNQIEIDHASINASYLTVSEKILELEAHQSGRQRCTK
jgi:hypothetical protein